MEIHSLETSSNFFWSFFKQNEPDFYLFSNVEDFLSDRNAV